MYIKLQEKEFDTLVKTADRYGVDINKLEQMYYKVTSGNLEQDLTDIAREYDRLEKELEDEEDKEVRRVR